MQVRPAFPRKPRGGRGCRGTRRGMLRRNGPRVTDQSPAAARQSRSLIGSGRAIYRHLSLSSRCRQSEGRARISANARSVLRSKFESIQTPCFRGIIRDRESARKIRGVFLFLGVPSLPIFFRHRIVPFNREYRDTTCRSWPRCTVQKYLPKLT